MGENLAHSTVNVYEAPVPSLLSYVCSGVEFLDGKQNFNYTNFYLADCMERLVGLSAEGREVRVGKSKVIRRRTCKVQTIII